jgi:hypothetical protein
MAKASVLKQVGKRYHFTLFISGAMTPTPQVENALFEAGCDDALLGSREGETFLDFEREEVSLEEALKTAVHQVESIGSGIEVERVEIGRNALVG